MAFRVGIGIAVVAIIAALAFVIAANYGVDFVWPSPKQEMPQLQPRPKPHLQNGDIVIAITKDGKILWNGVQISCAQFEARLPGVDCKKLTAPVGSGPDKIGFIGFEKPSPK